MPEQTGTGLGLLGQEQAKGQWNMDLRAPAFPGIRDHLSYIFKLVSYTCCQGS